VPSTIQDISYGQDVHRRIGAAIGLAVISFGIGGLMALTKSKKHYVGLTWATGEAKGGFAMQCDSFGTSVSVDRRYKPFGGKPKALSFPGSAWIAWCDAVTTM
jgi:hypothetical protein